MEFEYSFRYKFEAAHRFTNSCPDSCATPHGHTWYATLGLIGSVALGSEFSNKQMVAEFKPMKQPWKQLIDETFDHSFIVNAEDALIEPLTGILPNCRLIKMPGDPTTELIAACLFFKAQTLLSHTAKTTASIASMRVEYVKIEETPTNHVTCRSNELFDSEGRLHGFSGWWATNNTTDRNCSK